MQNILVPTDFSNNANHALSYASKLFGNRKCTFFLLNVYNEKKGFNGKRSYDDVAHVSDTLREKSKARLKQTLRKIKKKNPDLKHSYELISKPADLIQAVDELVEKLEIDLIVMGNKGKKSSIPVYLGSSATKTLASIKKCPVLLVPKNTDFNPTKRIALATDYKNCFNTSLIDPMIFIAQLWEASINILHIDTKKKLDDLQKSNLKALKTCLKSFSISFDRMPDFISKTKLIQLFLEDSNIGLLVMVNNEHGIFEKMLREPIIEKMVFNIDIPFLVIPEKP
ncbi:Nucleotide-binding universal stress protein, UspA family [Pricia antarctica]|uniref:Nucleotide-binding universal stress protein, UspA family n=1 Tax=Pricia antarctica TaxID=641691 RepID=A0A1G7DC20_9FLAO|nr:universal stress protein [Pricia antarctica]SDE48295.1 Nucleotide-binding universal stress protein, UspA family [Pricia antarctica]